LNNGRLDFIALKSHYEGVGINAIGIINADHVIEHLFYAGEKKPHMWWDEFERQLTKSFAVYDKKEGRQVYSDEMKLRILCRKVQADFLQQTRTTIQIDLTRDPVTMTYSQALTNFRNEVNRKFNPDMGGSNRSQRSMRRIQEMRRGGGRGRGRFGRFQGRGGRGGRFGRGFSGNRRPRMQGSRTVRGNDGREIVVHPAFNFTPQEWSNLPAQEQDRIRDERQEHKRRRQAAASDRSNNYDNNDRMNNSQQGRLSESPYDRRGTDDMSQLSEFTRGDGRYQDRSLSEQSRQTESGMSRMGGRNEQSYLRQQNRGNNN
jgi:hypothetical protein